MSALPERPLLPKHTMYSIIRCLEVRLLDQAANSTERLIVEGTFIPWNQSYRVCNAFVHPG
jgi:hypothetical protein